MRIASALSTRTDTMSTLNTDHKLFYDLLRSPQKELYVRWLWFSVCKGGQYTVFKGGECT